MNIEKRTETIEECSQIIVDRMQVELQRVYMKAYHEGRHDYRNQIKKFLIINPKYKNALEGASKNPCLNCDKASALLKLECIESQNCIMKQNQLIALDILKHYE